ncbi:MAG: hypothetical protein K2Y01_00455 [Rhabdochlamydiaceae bacterium]|nr:hypothetical protein [Rhabdochlamydiaceae bacterium]
MQVQLSDVVRLYAAEMAHASRCGTVEEIRDIVDHPPAVKDKTDSIGIKSIQSYGSSIVNMRATDRKQRYATVQAPSRYDSSYPVYEECMEEIKFAWKQPLEDLKNRLIGFRERDCFPQKSSVATDRSSEEISFPIEPANNSMVIRRREEPSDWCVIC